MNSEEQYKHIEHKIIEAAKNTDVSFEEESWVKMEALLNKDDNRKRFIWWWFLFIPVMIGGYGMYKNLNKASNPITEKNNIINTTVASNNLPLKNNKIASKTIAENASKNSVVLKQITKPIVSKKIVSNINTKALNSNTNNKNTSSKLNRETGTGVLRKLRSLNTNDDETENISNKKKNIFNQKSSTRSNIKNAIAETNEITATTKEEDIKKNSEANNEVANQNLLQKKDSNNNIISAKVKPIKKKTILSRFYLLAAAGVDNGSVKLLSYSNSKFVTKYGLGIGYNLSKKISVQSGIYFSNKKYTAGPTDYTAKAGSIVSRLNITKADAACKIYELPISLRYNFLQKSKWGFYATAGVSSYFMKEEFYNISYLRNNIEYTRPYTYTGNQHLFSTALLSVGIEKKISNRIAFQVEPIISIPLKTVGEGSVKLFSTSLHLGVRYHPFNKK